MSLLAIVECKLAFHSRITTGDKRWVGEALQREGIAILDGFLREQAMVRAFYRAYYALPRRRVVVCGINPGRLGAGKTGLPFLDYDTLRRLLADRFAMDGRRGGERSAAFVASVMDHFGASRFFDRVYLTNLSWFGFMRAGRNLNYDRLPPEIQGELLGDFLAEMDIVRPRIIVPAARSVAEGLARLRDAGKLAWPVGPRLNHPNFCAFPARAAEERRRWIDRLERHTARRAPKRRPHGDPCPH